MKRELTTYVLFNEGNSLTEPRKVTCIYTPYNPDGESELKIKPGIFIDKKV